MVINENLFLRQKSFWQGKRVLITGHTGFKGSWLTLWLLSLGANVWGYSLPPDNEKCLYNFLDLEKNLEDKSFGNISSVFGNILENNDLRSFISLSEPEIVFHLAAQPLVREAYKNPLLTWKTNVIGSLNLLEALKPLKQDCAVIMISTDKVYENREWLYGYREIDSLGGHDPYSASKASMEIAINVLNETLTFLNENKIVVPIGLNVEHIMSYNFQASIEMLQELARIYREFCIKTDIY